VTAYYLCGKGHVLSKIPGSAHPVEVSPDIFCWAEEAWPVWVECEGIGIGMTWDVASATRISVQKPCTSYICVAFIDLELNILHMLLNFVRR
jgi:hypothetical protein